MDCKILSLSRSCSLASNLRAIPTRNTVFYRKYSYLPAGITFTSSSFRRMLFCILCMAAFAKKFQNFLVGCLLLFFLLGSCFKLSVFLEIYCCVNVSCCFWWLLTGLIRTSVRCSMKSYKLSELTTSEVDSLKARPRIDFSSIFGTVSQQCFLNKFFISSLKLTYLQFNLVDLFWMLNELYQVQPIVDDVHNRGDAAVKELVLVLYFCLTVSVLSINATLYLICQNPLISPFSFHKNAEYGCTFNDLRKKNAQHVLLIRRKCQRNIPCGGAGPSNHIQTISVILMNDVKGVSPNILCCWKLCCVSSFLLRGANGSK